MREFLSDTIFGITVGTWLIISGCVIVVSGILYLIFRKKANAFLSKHREFVLYAVFGVLTTAVNYGVYYPLVNIPGMAEHTRWWTLIVNVFAWVASVLFAFVTNKLFVFKSRGKGKKTAFKELAAFFGARLASLAVEELVLFVFVTLLHFNENIIKLIASIGTVICNYFFSKFIIFKTKKPETDGEEKTETDTEETK